MAIAAPLAAAQGRDVSRLAADLTPAGAERAGTAGGIPAWQAPEPMGPGWTFGKIRQESFKYKDDKPLFSIDAGNAAKYADKLNPGQQQLLTELKGYRMDVYPSRRSCGVPDFVAENTRKNLGFAKLADDGVTLLDAHLPGVPFPFAQNGAEAMWNAKLRYRGLGMEYAKAQPTFLSPRRGSNEWLVVTGIQTTLFPWGAKGDNSFSSHDRTEAYLYLAYASPPALAGQAAVFSAVAGRPQEAFYYFPGQRRVRRMPTYAYDSPQIGYENQYTIDESYVFSGAMDRFDWKLVGKREMIVPFNSLRMYDFTAKREEALQPDFINPAFRRYELHRVWVVEATVRQGMRHTAPKRLFYIDEDSWSLLAAVDYDAQGKISKVREGYVIPVYETGTCDAFAFVQYNVNEGRYLVDGTPLGTGSDIAWITDAKGRASMKPDFYSSENLRAISER